MRILTCHAILFDLDGVLVDSTASVERHWRMWAARYGLNADLILANSHGQRTIDTMRAVASHLDLDLAREAQLMEEEEARDLSDIRAFPGALRLVSALPPTSWAIITSALHIMASTRLQAIGLPLPDVFITAEEVTQGKPHPEGYLKAAQMLGVAPQDCLVIEDAPAGIQAAHAGNIRVLGLTTTFPVTKLQDADTITSGLDTINLHIEPDPAHTHPRLTLRVADSPVHTL